MLQAAGGTAAQVAVHVPDLDHLRVNYRTHSGIMDVRALLSSMFLLAFAHKAI